MVYVQREKELILFLFIFFLCIPWVHGYQLKDFLPEHPLVFDVGTYMGKKTEEYLALGAKQVICVEPQQECVKYLSKKFSSNSKVVILPVVLAAEKGKIPFYICPEAATISTASKEWHMGRFKGYVWKDPVEVSATTLDALVMEYGVPDFCKIDVEGYELNVLQGLSSPIPCLSFEFTKEFLEDKTRLCLEHLDHMGFRYYNVIYGEGKDFFLKKAVIWQELFKMLQDDPYELLWGDIYAFQAEPMLQGL